MRIEILDDNGTVKNIIAASPEFAERFYPGRWRMADVDAADTLAEAKAERIARIKTEAAERISATDWRLERARERETAGWGTLADVDAVLVERESIRQCSDQAEQIVMSLDDIEAVRTFEWAVKAVVTNPERRTKRVVSDLFTDAEMTAIRNNPATENWWAKFCLSDHVSLVNPELVNGVNDLVLLGILTPARAAEILNTEDDA